MKMNFNTVRNIMFLLIILIVASIYENNARHISAYRVWRDQSLQSLTCIYATEEFEKHTYCSYGTVTPKENEPKECIMKMISKYENMEMIHPRSRII